MVLDFIRKLDLYKKVPHDLKKGTVSGAVISVVCVLLTVYLLLAELVLYSNGSLKTSIFVSYNNHEDDVNVRVNMTIQDKLCDDIILVIKNSHGQPSDTVPNIVHQQKDDDCNFYGHMSVKRTPGALFILPNAETLSENRYEYTVKKEDHVDEPPEDTKDAKVREQPKKKQQPNSDLDVVKKKEKAPCIKVAKGWIPPKDFVPPKGYKVVKKPKNMLMNHIIHTLEFGEPLPHKRRWNELLPPESKPFSQLSDTGREVPVNVAHDYHLKLVPTTFIDQNKRRINTFQYSYAYQNILMMTPAGIAPPSIIYRYEVSAMEIKYQYARKPLYHLLTMICAIVGGIVTVAGVIDKILFNAHQILKQKIELGKQS